MAKKFGKLLMVTAALGAVAGGAYYYLKGRDALMDDDFDDDDDFDNFEEDLDDTDRNYVDLDLGKTEENSAKTEFKLTVAERSSSWQARLRSALIWISSRKCWPSRFSSGFTP